MSAMDKSFHFMGIGTALPQHAIAHEEAAAIAVRLQPQARISQKLPRLYERTGVATRHSVLLEPRRNGAPCQSFFSEAADAADRGPGTAARMERYAAEAGGLATEAAGKALAQSALEPGAITHLITVSCSGFTAPGVDLALIQQLGLRATVERVHVGFMGCHGAINALRVAQAIAGSDPTARILLVAVELCSLHYQYTEAPDQHLANALFADGAAAVVGGASAEGLGWRIRGGGACILPDSLEDMGWQIGDHGFQMRLSKRVPGLIQQHLRGWLEDLLAQQGRGLEAVAHWAVHPGGPAILRASEKALELPPDACAESYAVLRDCGNMSSPTVLFILERMLEKHTPGSCVALGFGPGLAAEALLLDA